LTPRPTAGPSRSSTLRASARFSARPTTALGRAALHVLPVLWLGLTHVRAADSRVWSSTSAPRPFTRVNAPRTPSPTRAPPFASRSRPPWCRRSPARTAAVPHWLAPAQRRPTRSARACARPHTRLPLAPSPRRARLLPARAPHTTLQRLPPSVPLHTRALQLPDAAHLARQHRAARPAHPRRLAQLQPRPPLQLACALASPAPAAPHAGAR
jgi:hypothetical protein